MPPRPKMGSVYRRGGVFWIKYYREKVALYESSGSEDFTSRSSCSGSAWASWYATPARPTQAS